MNLNGPTSVLLPAFRISTKLGAAVNSQCCSLSCLLVVLDSIKAGTEQLETVVQNILRHSQISLFLVAESSARCRGFARMDKLSCSCHRRSRQSSHHRNNFQECCRSRTALRRWGSRTLNGACCTGVRSLSLLDCQAESFPSRARRFLAASRCLQSPMP